MMQTERKMFKAKGRYIMTIKRRKEVAVILTVIGMLVMSCYTSNVYAKEEKKLRGEVESYMIVKDIETNAVERIELDTDVTVRESSAGTIVESEVSTDNVSSVIETYDTQSSSKTAKGWKGTVKINYVDNGTTACLTSAQGTWKRVSGSLSMTNKSITYGQVLGTNSKNGTKSFSGSSVSVQTNFKHGKYGSGSFLGANISGKVDGKYITVVSNYNL